MRKWPVTVWVTMVVCLCLGLAGGGTPLLAARARSGTFSGLPVLATGQSGPDVQRLQAWLALAGTDPGPLDGRFGPTTVAALQSWQRQHGLPAAGTADADTLALLSKETVPYTVQAGDTIWVLAQRHNTDSELLVALNGLQDPDRLQPGQVLALPAPPSGSVPPPAVSAAAPPPPAAAPPPPAASATALSPPTASATSPAAQAAMPGSAPAGVQADAMPRVVPVVVAGEVTLHLYSGATATDLVTTVMARSPATGSPAAVPSTDAWRGEGDGQAESPASTAPTPLASPWWTGATVTADNDGPREPVVSVPLEAADHRAALTFNVPTDPSSQQVADLLGQLRAGGARATFFVAPAAVALQPDLPARITRSGHEVGLLYPDGHVGSDRDRIARQVRALATAAGQPVRFIRPASGRWLAADVAQARRLGLALVLWSSISLRGGRELTAADWTRRAERSLFPGAILMLNPTLGAAEPATAAVLAAARVYSGAEPGIALVALGDLLHPQPQVGPMARAAGSP